MVTKEYRRVLLTTGREVNNNNLTRFGPCLGPPNLTLGVFTIV